MKRQRPSRSAQRRHPSTARAAIAIAGLAAALAGVSSAEAAPPVAPTPAQAAALEELSREATVYEAAARDYRGVLTRIVQHHYEDRRRRVLAALDAELAVEKKGLRAAREEAIRRIEIFVAAHSGASAHPESTPDAMFRLAALYEERARVDTDASDELTRALRPAIALYKRILREFPAYRERAGVHYYLGHAYNDAGRVPEAQQVWRALVCESRYPYPTAPDAKDPERDTVRGLPQDHDRAYWRAWSARQPAPGGQGNAGKGERRAAGDEATFENPYPDECRPVPQQAAAGAEPRYLAEAWWLIGDHHFNEADPAGGPFEKNRAEAAYRQSLRFKKPPVHGVAMYKLAWTYFKQQRYEASVRAFVELLRYSDEQERLTADAGADFRAEAYTYIAGSLTFLDFAGPGAEAPFAPREDVLDTETNPRTAEQKMRVAIDRVQDGRLIPQHEKWTVDVYRALAQELRDLHQHHNVIEVDEQILKRWPLHRDAPLVQSEIADAHDQLAAQEREGTAAHAETAARALEARTRLSAYVGTTAWVKANQSDAEAILAADRLARGGLRRAAADHTNAGSALVERARGAEAGPARDAVLERALGEYRLAAQAWGSPTSPEEEASGGYERRYWLADARHHLVGIEVQLGRRPSDEEVEAARAAAVSVRDSNEDDRYFEPAAQMVVDVAQQVLNERYDRYRRTHGAEGLEPRERIKTTGAGASERVVTEPLPREVADAIAAREEYIARVPAARDPYGNAALYAYQIADLELLHGQLDEARRRFQPIYEAQCRKTSYGFKAWVRLLTMANLEHDGERSGALARSAATRSCATTPEEAALEEQLSRGTIDVLDYGSADKAFESARTMPDGPARAARWRQAAALYRAALERAPAADAAPEAAINGAHASKQVGDYEQAIGMYELFVREYGSESGLARLEKGDPGASPPRAPDPRRYAERVGFLQQAHGALAAARVLLFDYRRAAETFDTIAGNARFQPAARRDAARNAVLLHAHEGDRERLLGSHAAFLRLDPPAEQRAEVDYLVAQADLESWDEHGLDEGANRAARLRAVKAMDAYQAANKGNPAAAAEVVRAAYHGAALRRAGRDPRASEACKDTVAAFERLRAASPVVEGHNRALGSAEAELAAECAYRLVDEKLGRDFDFATGHHRYAGTVEKVKGAYEADLRRAEGYFNELQGIVGAFESKRWTAAARARQGTLYDGCRTGLYHARAPGLELFTDREERLLGQLARGSAQQQEQADAYRQKRREDWRTAREALLDDADRLMVKLYTESVVLARAWKLGDPTVDAAAQRLAALTPLLGDAKLRGWSERVVDPQTRGPFAYRDGMWVTSRAGMTLAPPTDSLAAPRPAAP
jgi:hypothetical protein